MRLLIRRADPRTSRSRGRDVGPAGWVTRNYVLQFEVKGAHEILPTRAEAMRVAEAWFLALDIELWE